MHAVDIGDDPELYKNKTSLWWNNIFYRYVQEEGNGDWEDFVTVSAYYNSIFASTSVLGIRMTIIL